MSYITQEFKEFEKYSDQPIKLILGDGSEIEYPNVDVLARSIDLKRSRIYYGLTTGKRIRTPFYEVHVVFVDETINIKKKAPKKLGVAEKKRRLSRNIKPEQEVLKRRLHSQKAATSTAKSIVIVYPDGREEVYLTKKDGARKTHLGEASIANLAKTGEPNKQGIIVRPATEEEAKPLREARLAELNASLEELEQEILGNK